MSRGSRKTRACSKNIHIQEKSSKLHPIGISIQIAATPTSDPTLSLSPALHQNIPAPVVVVTYRITRLLQYKCELKIDGSNSKGGC